ncbi:MAG: magnesium transporter [Opitutales bacterium]|nr:magnesium transporter [Opitutales bacterium]
MRRYLDTQDAGELKKLLGELHPSVIAEAMEAFSTFEVNAMLALVDARRRADLFSFLPFEQQLDVAALMEEGPLAELVTVLSHDERVDLLSEMPEERKEAVLRKLAQKEREDIRKLDRYDEGTIGAIMTSDYASLPRGVTAREALEQLRREAPDAETIYYAYVLDEERRLVGVVSLKQLILAKPDAVVGDFMRKPVISVFTRDPEETAVRELAKADLLALPVHDREGKMVGIVTHDDLADVAEEASTEDFHRMAAAPGLSTLAMRDATIPQVLLKRLPWLLLLVFINIFSGAGIAYFEDTIEAVVALVFFLPLLIDSGGNAGSQAATLMVRALATGDVRMRDWFSLLRREVGISLVMGVVMGCAVALVATFRAPEVIMIVSMTMTLTVLTGSLIGMLLPFILTKLKLDPATASAPLITSLADICGVLIYFSIATWWLGLGG